MFIKTKLQRLPIILPVIVLTGILIAGCAVEKPEEVLILKAKDKTRFLLDSLENNANMLITDIELTEEFFDENTMKYIINYQITSGLDSTSMTRTDASAFIEQIDGIWKYRFTFYETYIRPLESE
jgi:hypothetical protein